MNGSLIPNFLLKAILFLIRLPNNNLSPFLVKNEKKT